MGLKDLKMNMQISQRPLDMIYMIDVSGSMYGQKIQAVNNAMQELERTLRDEAKKNPNAQVYVRVLTFGGDCAKWHLGNRTKVEDFKYDDINYVAGCTPMGSAFELLDDAIKMLPNRCYKPMIVLLSDGEPTDDYEQPLQKLLSSNRAKNAVKIAISIGQDADDNMLSEFTMDKNLVLKANNATYLKNLIRWTSTLVGTITEQKKENDNNRYVATIKAPEPHTVITDEDF